MPKTITGTPLRQSSYLAKVYNDQLQKLIDQMTKDVESELKKLFSQDFAAEYFDESTGQDASISSQARILLNRLFGKYGERFNRKADKLADFMVMESFKRTGTQMQSSLKAMSSEFEINPRKITDPINEVLTASIQENVNLIKTIPERYLNQVQGQVMRSITTGSGLEMLTPFFAEQKGISKRHAKNMALDQTRKAHGAINKARMQSAGITKFKWKHSGGGQKPRKHHLDNYPVGLNNGIFRFDDLPVIDEKTGERGIPSQAINCKCIMIPVIEFDE